MNTFLPTTLLATFLLSAALAAHAQPQPHGSMGGMPGMGGSGHAGGCCSANDTPGWAMMTKEERARHHDSIMGAKDYPGCHAYLEDHHKRMQERAKQKGTPLPPGGPGPACDRLKK